MMESAFGRDRGGDVLDLAHLAEIGTFMDRVFSPRQGERAEPAAAAVAAALEPARLDGPSGETEGFDVLLLKASRAIEILATRCEILEHDLAEAGERAAEHEQTSERWKTIAVELRSQASFHRKEIDELKARSELVEAQVLLLEAATKEARDRVAVADARSTRLQGQVVAAFGRKSPIHSVLQSIVLQEAAE
jgi:hypothetical protein